MSTAKTDTEDIVIFEWTDSQDRDWRLIVRHREDHDPHDDVVVQKYWTSTEQWEDMDTVGGNISKHETNNYESLLDDLRSQS